MKLLNPTSRCLFGAALLSTSVLAMTGSATAAPRYYFDYASKDKNPGSSTGHQSRARNVVTIRDKDGIDWYQVSQAGAKQPLKGFEKVDGECEPEIPIELNPISQGGAVRVQFKDCSDDRNAHAFLINSFPRTGGQPPVPPSTGKPVPWRELQGSELLTVSDVNVDGIPDVLVLDELTGLVTVFIGNGDGSLQDPSLSIGRVRALPETE